MNRLKEKVDVIIPVCQPDKRFFKLLAGLAMQTVVPEKVYLLNVESGEPEDSCEALSEQIYHYFGKRKSFGKRLPLAIEIIGIDPEEFNQGETRHQGALASTSPFLLFMRQNAVPADEKLIALAKAAAEQTGSTVRIGRVASGDQFVADPALKDRIIQRTQALCTEMEGAAIAQTAYRNAIPFVILRCISDKADHSVEMDYPSFEAMAAKRCAQVAKTLAVALPTTV